MEFHLPGKLKPLSPLKRNWWLWPHQQRGWGMGEGEGGSLKHCATLAAKERAVSWGLSLPLPDEKGGVTRAPALCNSIFPGCRLRKSGSSTRLCGLREATGLPCT